MCQCCAVHIVHTLEMWNSNDQDQAIVNAITIIKSLLRGDTSITPEGQFADLTLPKKAGVVRRRRDYRVYLPAGYDGQTALPMVMVLHGCKQNNAEMETITGFDKIANP